VDQEVEVELEVEVEVVMKVLVEVVVEVVEDSAQMERPRALVWRQSRTRHLVLANRHRSRPAQRT
jgi:hypothetical protein